MVLNDTHVEKTISISSSFLINNALMPVIKNNIKKDIEEKKEKEKEKVKKEEKEKGEKEKEKEENDIEEDSAVPTRYQIYLFIITFIMFFIFILL
jgi:ADP-ribosylglycohydrolase